MIYLNLEDFQFNELFTKITNIFDFLKVKLKALEYILTFWHGNVEVKPPYLCVDDKNLHRIFLVNHDSHKIISFGFEFLIKTEKVPLDFPVNSIPNLNYIHRNGSITTKEISNAFTILNEFSSREENYYWGLNLDEDNIPDSSISFFEYLLMAEPGYIRYDDDLKGEKSKIHPRFHFDINYNNITHYKLGLPYSIELENFITALDLRKDCPITELNPSRYDFMVRSTYQINNRKSKRHHHK